MSDESYWLAKSCELESKLDMLMNKLTNFQKVQQFHKVFQKKVADTPVDLTERILPEEIYEEIVLRMKLIKEEYDEVMYELENATSIEKIAKELSDLLYVVYGCADVLGIPIDDCFAEVHRSNMSKLDKDGNPIFREDGKILKSELYSPADLSSILKKTP